MEGWELLSMGFEVWPLPPRPPSPTPSCGDGPPGMRSPPTFERPPLPESHRPSSAVFTHRPSDPAHRRVCCIERRCPCPTMTIPPLAPVPSSRKHRGWCQGRSSVTKRALARGGGARSKANNRGKKCHLVLRWKDLFPSLITEVLF